MTAWPARFGSFSEDSEMQSSPTRTGREIEEKLLLFFIFLYVSVLGVLLMAGVYWMCR